MRFIGLMKLITRHALRHHVINLINYINLPQKKSFRLVPMPTWNTPPAKW